MERIICTAAVIIWLSSKVSAAVNLGVKCDPDIPSRLPPLQDNVITVPLADEDMITDCGGGEYLDGDLCSRVQTRRSGLKGWPRLIHVPGVWTVSSPQSTR